MVRPGQAAKVISGPTRPSTQTKTTSTSKPAPQGTPIKALPTPVRPVATTQKNPTVFPTAAGGALQGKTVSAPGNAMNKVTLDAWRASGGTTTSTYRDKYTNLTNPGESALQEAKRVQEYGAAKIYERVGAAASAKAVSEGRAAIKPTVYTRTLDNEGTKQNVLTGDIIPPEKKIIAAPIEQDEPTTQYSPMAITRPYSQAPIILDTMSRSNNLPPAKGTLQGAVNRNSQSPASALRANLQGIKSMLPILNAMPGMQGVSNMFKGLIQQLGPGVSMRLSAKGRR